jgi:thioredoxin
MTVIELTHENFESEIKKSKLMIVDFYANWCGPCQMLKPVFKKVSEEFKKIKFAKVNTEEEQELAEKCEIKSIPCLIIFRNGEEIERMVGYQTEDDLREKVDELG